MRWAVILERSIGGIALVKSYASPPGLSSYCQPTTKRSRAPITCPVERVCSAVARFAGTVSDWPVSSHSTREITKDGRRSAHRFINLPSMHICKCKYTHATSIGSVETNSGVMPWIAARSWPGI